MTAAVMDRAEAVQQLEGLVKRWAKRFSMGLDHRGNHYADLEQEGICGVLTALDRFDPAQSTKLSTYAFPYIISAMQQYAEQFTVDVPISHELSVSMKKRLTEEAKQPRPPVVHSVAMAKRNSLYCEDVSRVPAPDLPVDDLIALSYIYEEILNLPVAQQHALIGCYFEHKKLDVIGKEMGRCKERVRQLRENGLTALRQLIRRKYCRLKHTN